MAESFRILLRSVQNVLEATFEKKRKLIRCGQSGLIRIELRTQETQVILSDGTVIPRGAQVAQLHLDSREISRIYGGASPNMKTRIQLLKEARDSFRWISSWLQKDPIGMRVAAIHSVTFLDKELLRFGFEIRDLPLWPWVLQGIHMRYLSYLYRVTVKRHFHPENVSGTPETGDRGKAGYGKQPSHGLLEALRGYVPKEAWMSRQAFIERFQLPPRDNQVHAIFT